MRNRILLFWPNGVFSLFFKNGVGEVGGVSIFKMDIYTASLLVLNHSRVMQLIFKYS